MKIAAKMLSLFFFIYLLLSCGRNDNDSTNEQTDFSGVYNGIAENNCNLTIIIKKENSGFSYIISGDNIYNTGKITVEKEDGKNYLVFSGKIGDNQSNSLRSLHEKNTLSIQNYGNSMNEYVFFKDCNAKYLTFNKE